MSDQSVPAQDVPSSGEQQRPAPRRIPFQRRSTGEPGASVLQRVRKRAASAVTAPPPPRTDLAPVPPVAVPEEERNNRLLRMSPFSIGFFGMLGALVAFFLWGAVQQVGPIILMIVVAMFLALGLNPVVEWLMERGIKRWLAVGVVAVIALAILAAALLAVVPLVIEQATTLSKNLPTVIQQLRSNEQVARLDEQFQVLQKLNDAVANKDVWGGLAGGLMGTGKVVINIVGSTVITTVLTFFFLASLPQIKEIIYQLAPASRRPRARYLANEMFRRVGGYLSGMFLVSTAQAVAAFVMMSVVGLGKFALALAFIVALFAYIPLVGSPTAMIIIALIALSTVGWIPAVAVIGFFLIYQQIEAYVILPNVMKRSVNVPGAITVLAALAGGTLLGAVGALIAVPTAAVLLLMYREVVVPALDRS